MDEVDLVEILVPHHLHIDVALEAILRKKSISLQKPMCMNISEANKLISDYKNRVPTASMLADNNYSGTNYKIQCWYTETVKIKQSKDIK